MKLYLSSYGLGNDPQKLAGMVGSNKKAAVIANAMDFLTNKSDREESVQKELNELKDLALIRRRLICAAILASQRSWQQKCGTTVSFGSGAAMFLCFGAPIKKADLMNG